MSKNSATAAEAFGYTQVKGTNKGLLSPTFSIDSNDGLTWCLEIYDNILTSNGNYTAPFVGLSLICVSNNSDKPTTVECKFSLLNGKGSVMQEIITNNILPAKDYCDSNYDFFSFPTFISKTTLLNNLEAVTLNQSITVICEICASSESENYQNQIVIPESVLPDPLQLLFENPQFSDITLSANGTDFKVHKVILATRCQVFESMFNANTKENYCNRVEITDLNEVTLREVLRFIYTGKVLNLQEFAEDLLRAADKYSLRTLRDLCVIELNGQLTITNALSMFKLADMHSANELKGFVKNFIHIHFLDVVSTSEWKIMVQKQPELAKEILIIP